ncbi:MAG: exo-alpha-sialidase [Planctomycetaceae bacterium]
MSDRFHVATRKGVFTVSRESAGWKISKADFLGSNATIVMQDRRDGCLYAALDHGHFGVKLHRSFSDGETWEEVAVPVFPQYTEADAARQAEAGEWGARRNFASLQEIWELTPGGSDQPGVLWAGTIPGGLFRSEDRGSSWEMMESLWNRDDRWQWFGGGKSSPGIHSVAVHPQNNRHITIAISCGGAWVTEDGGLTWNPRSSGMRSDYLPPDQAGNYNSQDVHRLVQCPADPETMWVQHHNGIFHTTNGGRHWNELTHVPPSVFGFAVVVHPHDPLSAWFVPGVKDECRIPVDARMAVSRTRDGGQTFEVLRNGLPQDHCYDIVYRHCLDIDETGERLVMGSSTGSLWISENGGDSWQTISTHLPPIYCTRFA